MPGDVVVVGSLHYDIMVKAPDRPRKGETVLGEAWWPKCGGKGGNQAVEAAFAGASVAMVGAVGDDDFGRTLLAHLKAAGVATGGIAVLADAKSGMSVAIEDASGDYGAVVVSGANRRIVVDEGVVPVFKPGGVLVLQNEIPAAANLAAARLAKAKGCRIVFNAAPALEPDPALDMLVDVLVVNAIEAEMLGGGPVTDLASARDAADRLSRGSRTVVVTAGGDGVAYAGPGFAGDVEAEPVRLVSTHGAGDCFVGTLAAGLAAGAAFGDAIRAANAAAGRLVSLTEAERTARSRQAVTGR